MNEFAQTLLMVAIGLLLVAAGFIVYHFRVRRKRENKPPLLAGLYGLGVLFPSVFGVMFIMTIIVGANSSPPSSVQIGELVNKQLPNATLQRIDFVKDEPRGWVLLTIGEHKNVLVQAIYTQQHGWQLSCLNASGTTKPLNNRTTANILQQTAQCS